jgi:RimJ/RimL family protein N-acetyltransferase
VTLPWEFTAPIETPRLRLRGLTLADVDDLHAYQGRDDVATYLLHPARSREKVAEMAGEYAAHTRLEQDGDWIQPGIEIDGRIRGHLYLNLHSAEQLGAEIGWSLHPDVGGRGYATEAATALLDVAFGEMGLHRVRADLDLRNTASAALARRLGMREEARHRQDVRDNTGAWSDSLVFAILEDEWAARREDTSRP